MDEDERSAALAIAKAAVLCSREGAELMSRLKSTIAQNDSVPRDQMSHASNVDYPSSLANSLGIEYPKTSTAGDGRRKRMTEDEILEAMADIRDEKGPWRPCRKKILRAILQNPPAPISRRMQPKSRNPSITKEQT